MIIPYTYFSNADFTIQCLLSKYTAGLVLSNEDYVDILCHFEKMGISAYKVLNHYIYFSKRLYYIVSLIVNFILFRHRKGSHKF